MPPKRRGVRQEKFQGKCHGASWKGVPVVRRKAGGLSLQVTDGQQNSCECCEKAAEKSFIA